MTEYDSIFVFMPLPEAQAYFNRPNDVTAIEVFTTNPDKIDVYRKTVTEAAGRPVFLVDWRQRNSTFFNALQVERNVMFLILTLIVLVAALNIVSGLIMLVKDKGRDIGILRTMGASKGAIMRVFLITGASIGVVGTLAGDPDHIVRRLFTEGYGTPALVAVALAGSDVVYRVLVLQASELARAGKLDPVIGRDDEIRRVIQVLSRRTKNNPVLIGEPGVGKTAIAEGLAQRIISNQVPDLLKIIADASLAWSTLARGRRLLSRAHRGPGPAGRMSAMRTTVAARPRRDIIAACASSVLPKIALRACRGWPTTLVM